jgi:hypothetical protein
VFILNNSSIKVVISVESVLAITHFSGRHQKWWWFGRKEVCCFYSKHNELLYEITPILIALFPIQHHLLPRIRPINRIALTQIFFFRDEESKLSNDCVQRPNAKKNPGILLIFYRLIFFKFSKYRPLLSISS